MIGVFTILFLVSGGIVLTNVVKADSDNSANEAIVKPGSLSSIVIGKDGIKNNKEKWESFVQESKSKRVTSILLKYQSDMHFLDDSLDKMELKDVVLKYDGENYCYWDGKTSKKYKYLLELSGRTPKASCDTTYVILSDEKYTFDDVSKSIYSSNSNDHIPYQLLFC